MASAPTHGTSKQVEVDAAAQRPLGQPQPVVLIRGHPDAEDRIGGGVVVAELAVEVGDVVDAVDEFRAGRERHHASNALSRRPNRMQQRVLLGGAPVEGVPSADEPMVSHESRPLPSAKVSCPMSSLALHSSSSSSR